MYKVLLTPVAAEAFADLHPDIRRQIKTGMKKLSDKPHLGKMLLSDLVGYRSFRIRRYRVIYRVDEDVKAIKMFMVGHRRDIYDLFSEFVKR